MTVTISANGWIIETTHTVNGMLAQGGVSGRRELVTNEHLEKVGIVGDPDDMYNDYVTNEDRVRYAIRHEEMPTKVIRKGHTIY